MSHLHGGRSWRACLSAITFASATMIAGALAAPAMADEPPPRSPGLGLLADYYVLDNSANDRDPIRIGEHKASVIERDINTGPGLPGIFNLRAGRSEFAAVTWSGYLQVPVSGDYTFYAVGDDGFRVNVDNQTIIDFWTFEWEQPQTSAPLRLEAGQLYPFSYEAIQGHGGARQEFSVSGPDLPKQVVPASFFSLPSELGVAPISAEVHEDGVGVTLTYPAEAPLTINGELTAEDFAISIDGEQGSNISGAVFDPSANAINLALDNPVVEGAYVDVAPVTDKIAVDGSAVTQTPILAVNNSQHFMQTRWASEVDPQKPLPEYPRPALSRESQQNWLNLNGAWEFETFEDANAPTVFGTELSQEIVVPFTIESELSGIGDRAHYMQYRKLINSADIPAGERTLINFGAVDYQSWVYVNGAEAGHHIGGYDPFSYDITDYLHDGDNEIIVRVTDETNNTQPKGKQTNNPEGIWYTPSSGIWQTVWLESVPTEYLTDVVITPDLDNSQFLVTPRTASDRGEVQIEVKDSEGNAVLASASGNANSQIAIPLPEVELWSPDNPYLYRINVQLTVDGATDSVESYAGMRKIEVKSVGDTQRIFLNNQQTFLLSTLDQGWWPDGVMTAPTDEALAWDIQATKDLGFNTIRKHIKVEPARWYYHADTIGMMVWQDMPSISADNGDGYPQFETEMRAMMDNLRSVTSIIGWIPFNEGWGEWNLDDTSRIATWVKDYDNTRLLNIHSGYNCCNSKGDSKTGDIRDWHAYAGPADPGIDPDGRASIDGEHGGYSRAIPGHTWRGGAINIYDSAKSTEEELTNAYVDNTQKQIPLAARYLSGSVYTQITDLEGESNGFYTYDREVAKMDFDRVRDVNNAVIQAGAGSSTEPVEPALSGYYPLEEGNGTSSADGSGNGNDLTLNGETTWVEGSNPGAGSDYAVGFSDGSNATANVPELDTLGSYTVSAWVQFDEEPVGDFVTIASMDGYDGTSAFFLQYSKNIEGGFAMSMHGEPRAVAQVVPTVGQWYHLAGVFDAEASTLSIYVDGQHASTSNVSASTMTNGTFALGRGQFGGRDVDFLNGNVDEVTLYNFALNDADITELSQHRVPLVDEPTEPISDGSVTVSGAPEEGKTLTALPSQWPDGSEYTYQWLVSESADGANAEAIEGINEPTVVLDAKHVGKYIAVQITATHESLEGPRTVTSQYVGPVAAQAGQQPGNTDEPGDGKGKPGTDTEKGDLAVTGATVGIVVAVLTAVLLTAGVTLRIIARRRQATSDK